MVHCAGWRMPYYTNRRFTMLDPKVIQAARRTDLGQFLVSRHPDSVVVTGNCIHLKAHDSLHTKFGFSGYTRFSSNETGNAIDFLTRYLDYSFTDAVNALAAFGHTLPEKSTESIVKSPGLVLPDPAKPPYKRVFAYLNRKEEFRLTSSSGSSLRSFFTRKLRLGTLCSYSGAGSRTRPAPSRGTSPPTPYPAR